MQQHLSMVTLGVADLKRAVQFYENVVGWGPLLGQLNPLFLISAG